MACDITSGFELACRDSIGGIKNIYILSGSIASVTGAGAGLLTDISGVGTFYKFELVKQTGDFTETPTPSVENGTVFFDQVVNAPFHKLQSSIRNQVKVLAQNQDLKIIIETNNGTDDSVGKFFLAGQSNGMTLTGGSGATGTAYGDLNGYSLTFGGQEPYPASECSGSDLAAIMSGISVV